MNRYAITIHNILISPEHGYFGQDAAAFVPNVAPPFGMGNVQVHAGKGLVGDRFYDVKPDFDGQVTFVSSEMVDLLRAELEQPALRADLLRRNLLVEGVALNGLIGQEFEIDCDDAQPPIRFFGAKHCSPCKWMDLGVADGAWKLLKGRGGLRAQVLTDGVLRTGAAELSTTAELPLDAITERLPRPNLL